MNNEKVWDNEYKVDDGEMGVEDIIGYDLNF